MILKLKDGEAFDYFECETLSCINYEVDLGHIDNCVLNNQEQLEERIRDIVLDGLGYKASDFNHISVILGDIEPILNLFWVIVTYNKGKVGAVICSNGQCVAYVLNDLGKTIDRLKI